MKKVLLGIGLIAVLLVVAYFIYYIFVPEYVLDGKLETLEFAKEGDLYIREVTQGEEVYIETLAIEENQFMRVLSADEEQEVFAYNYETEVFTYLYKFGGEEIYVFTYDCLNNAILSDEDGIYETMELEITDLETYFTEMLVIGEIEVSEL